MCVVPRFCINTLNHVKIRVKLSRNAKTPGRRDSGAPRARRECIQQNTCILVRTFLLNTIACPMNVFKKNHLLNK